MANQPLQQPSWSFPPPPPTAVQVHAQSPTGQSAGPSYPPAPGPLPTQQQDTSFQHPQVPNSYPAQEQSFEQPADCQQTNAETLPPPPNGPQQPQSSNYQPYANLYPTSPAHPTQAHVAFAGDEESSSEDESDNDAASGVERQDFAFPIDQPQQTAPPDLQQQNASQPDVRATPPRIDGEERQFARPTTQIANVRPTLRHDSHQTRPRGSPHERRTQMEHQPRPTNSSHRREERASSSLPQIPGTFPRSPASQRSERSHQSRRAPHSEPARENNDRHHLHQRHGARRGEADNYYDESQSFATAPAHTTDPATRSRQHSRHRSGHYRSYRRRRHAPTEQEIDDMISRSTLKPGFVGYLKGMWHLARKKPYVHEDTPERLDLLARADYFFNDSVTRHFFNPKKAGRFREEMVRVARNLQRARSNNRRPSSSRHSLRRRAGHEQRRRSDDERQGYDRSHRARGSLDRNPEHHVGQRRHRHPSEDEGARYRSPRSHNHRHSRSPETGNVRHHHDSALHQIQRSREEIPTHRSRRHHHRRWHGSESSYHT